MRRIKWRSFDDDPPPTGRKILAMGRAPWDQGEKHDHMYIATLEFVAKEQNWRMARTGMLFFPVKWIFAPKARLDALKNRSAAHR